MQFATSIVRQRVRALRALFRECGETLYVRGSYARGDARCNDIDISAYTALGKIGLPDPPLHFDNLPINYGGIPFCQLEEYFALCPRGASSLMEMQPVITSDERVPTILARQRAHFQKYGVESYLLFLLTEEETNGRIADRSVGNSYFALKRCRGSKRTISRVVWAFKARQRDLRVLSHQEAIREMVNCGEMPGDVATSCCEILRTTSDGGDVPTWLEHTAKIAQWYEVEYAPMLRQTIRCIPECIIDSTLACAQAETPAADLEYAYRLCQEQTGQIRWIVLFALSGNWNMPVEYLVAMWCDFAGNRAYSNIVRNLAANIAMPASLIKCGNDKLMLRALEVRHQLEASH